MARAMYIVAVCDVLGFSNFVDETPLEELITRYENLVKAAKPHRFFSNTPTGRVADIPGVTSAVFNDTILLWARDDPESIESFCEVCGQSYCVVHPRRSSDPYGDRLR